MIRAAYTKGGGTFHQHINQKDKVRKKLARSHFTAWLNVDIIVSICSQYHDFYKLVFFLVRALSCDTQT